MTISPVDPSKCVCPAGQKYDASKGRCVCAGDNQKQSSLTKPFTCLDCPAGTTIDAVDPTKCNCPPQQSFTDGACKCPLAVHTYDAQAQ